MKKPTRAELEVQLAETRRAFYALQEWYNIAIRHGDPETVLDVTLEDGRTVMHLRVRGMCRPCGGVVVVDMCADGNTWINDPQYLDDLVSNWSALAYDPYRRTAASQLRQLQKAANEQENMRKEARDYATQSQAATVRP